MKGSQTRSPESWGGFPWTPTISVGGQIVNMKDYQTKSLRCLGIDPGIANTGIGIVALNGTNYRLLHTESIETDSKLPNSARYLRIHDRIRCLLTEWDARFMSVEQVYHNRNVSSSMTTAGVIGIVELIAAQVDIPCHVVRPQAVKEAVGCFGNADKKSVTIAVKRLLHTTFEQVKTHHAADACAAAVAGILKERSTAFQEEPERRDPPTDRL